MLRNNFWCSTSLQFCLIDMGTTPLSIQDVAQEYNNSSDIAYLYNLETFLISLCYGPILILSIKAHTRLRRRSSTNRSLKWLSLVILIQIIFVTLRVVGQLGENILAFKQNRILSTADNEVEKVRDAIVKNTRFGMLTIGEISSRVVEALANGVVVWRAISLYLGNWKIKYFLAVAWFCDLAVGMVYGGFFLVFLRSGGTQFTESTVILMYSVRWTSFALNLAATILIAYRTWKLRGMLSDTGLTPNRSNVYNILARLVETGVILLAVQLLIAVLAVTYTSGDPADPGYIALTAVIDISFMIINAHPAGMALVAEGMWAKQGELSGDTKANCDTTFRAANNSRTGSFSESSRKLDRLVYLEKSSDHR
ncbi:hypothetical protein DL96DRAFT_1625853 [Flagelloscypha sp. PMI_526]|nr:hypothetical protein DL96DRAFT_1625853 [Flagelloscypha sp. PMI_526]